MRVAIANFSPPTPSSRDFRAAWARFTPPALPPPIPLLEQPFDWGFHILAVGVHMRALGAAEQVELWSYAPKRRTWVLNNGVLRIDFENERDLAAYLAEHGCPDLFINYGMNGRSALRLLEGQCFRVHVPCLRAGLDRLRNRGAECYLVDDERYLDARSMLYVPVVNVEKIKPAAVEKQRDFIYLAAAYGRKRHDLLLDAVRGTELTGHLHPVDAGALDLTGCRITTSAWNERSVPELLQTSRIAVYPGDRTSNPAAMWECVAAGLPIVVNKHIGGGKHIVVPGVTGELAAPRDFRAVMQRVLDARDTYRPREYLAEHWDPIATVERYLAFFTRMGLSWPSPAKEPGTLAETRA